MTNKSPIRIGSFALGTSQVHLIFVLTALVVSAFLYGDIVTWSRKLVFQGYLKVTGEPLNYYISVDEDGVPFLMDKTIGKQRNNVTVCNTALEYLERIKKGDPSPKRFFLNCADWLVNNRAFRNDSSSVLEYHYDWPIYNMKSPWQSGMAQGLSLQVLINAHEMTKDEKYLTAATQQLNSFYIAVEDNGVTYKSDQGWWYEEFADREGKESRVLNGMIYAVLGINDYYQYTKSERAKFLFDQGVLAIKLNLPAYDNGGVSFYDRLGTKNLKYHKVHIDLLRKLFACSGEPTFNKMANRWDTYADPSVVVRLFRGEMKLMYVAYFLVNAAVIFIMFEVVYVLFLISRRILK